MTSPPAGSLAERSAWAFAAYQNGERERMGDLVDLLTPILWHTARSQRLDHAAAEDAVQLAWMRLVEHADTIQDARAVLSWLITTVRREAWRLTRRDQRLTVTDELPETDGDTAPAPLDPALAAVLNDDQARLWQHVSGLPERCRALLRVVAFVDRPDYSEVSRALGMPVGSIGPTRGRCLAKLRAALLADPTWSST
ncbi:MAG: RNA polymerase sigma factor [Dermatophilaceae bacterium]